MKYLLDTNVISEWTKPRPDVSVVRWLDGAKEDDLFLSVITLGELWHGIERLPQGKRRAALAEWVEQDLSARFEERLLGIDERIARIWGVLLAASQQRGGPCMQWMRCWQQRQMPTPSRWSRGIQRILWPAGSEC